MQIQHGPAHMQRLATRQTSLDLEEGALWILFVRSILGASKTAGGVGVFLYVVFQRGDGVAEGRAGCLVLEFGVIVVGILLDFSVEVHLRGFKEALGGESRLTRLDLAVADEVVGTLCHSIVFLGGFRQVADGGFVLLQTVLREPYRVAVTGGQFDAGTAFGFLVQSQEILEVAISFFVIP